MLLTAIVCEGRQVGEQNFSKRLWGGTHGNSGSIFGPGFPAGHFLPTRFRSLKLGYQNIGFRLISRQHRASGSRSAGVELTAIAERG